MQVAGVSGGESSFFECSGVGESSWPAEGGGARRIPFGSSGYRAATRKLTRGCMGGGRVWRGWWCNAGCATDPTDEALKTQSRYLPPQVSALSPVQVSLHSGVGATAVGVASVLPQQH